MEGQAGHELPHGSSRDDSARVCHCRYSRRHRHWQPAGQSRYEITFPCVNPGAESFVRAAAQIDDRARGANGATGAVKGSPPTMWPTT